jgi:AcrR family transcriptional regulator
MDSPSRAPRQARSRQTMERLLTATLAVLEEKGLSGVTIPEIAAAAGLSTGSIYRRFIDKEALIRGAFLQLLEASQAANRASLPPNLFEGRSLNDALHVLGRALVAQYRGRTGLLKALDQFLDVQTDGAFRARAVDLIEANMRRLVETLLPFRDEIAAEDPERAIIFALLSATTLIEVHKLHTPLLWRRMLQLDEDALAGEAARTMAAYLASRV